MQSCVLQPPDMQVDPAIAQHTRRLQIEIRKQMLGLQQDQQAEGKGDWIAQEEACVDDMGPS